MRNRRFSSISASLLALLSPFMIQGALYAQDASGGAAAAASTSSVAAPAAGASSAATSTSTASSTAADAGASASAGTGAAAVDATPTQNDGESTADFFQRVIEGAATAQDDTEDGDDTQTDAEELQAAIDGKEKTEDSTEKTGEEDAAGGDGDGEEDFGYDPYLPPGANLAPKELNEKINANAAMKAALDADPALKQTLFEQSRAAAETGEYKQFFQTPDEARIASETSKEYNTLSELVTNIQKPEDAQGFYNHLLQLSVLHDEEGNVVMRDGKPVSDGTVGRLINHTGDLFLRHFEGLAKGDQGKGIDGDEELAVACDILRERAFGGPKQKSTEGMTEEQRATQARLDARDAEQKAADKTQRETAHTNFEQGIATAIDTHSDSEINSLLGRSDGITDKAGTATKIRDAAYALVAANDSFKIEQDALMRRADGPKAHEARVTLAKKWMAKALPIVAPKIIAEAGGKIMARQQRTDAKQKARVEASRSETPGGTLRSAKSANTGSANDLMASVTADFKTKNGGREPNTAELLQGLMNAQSAK